MLNINNKKRAATPLRTLPLRGGARVCNLFIILLLFLTTTAQADNTLSVPGVTAGWGTTIALSVNMENSDANVAAVQFTLELPDGATLRPDRIEKSERIAAHTVSVRRTERGKYTFIILSSEGQAIRGYSGTLLTVDMQIGSPMSEGHSYPMTITNAVMSLNTGENVLQETTAGTITVARSTDFTVSNVTVSQTETAPGETIDVSWTVSNIGEVAATGGWHEQVLLVSFDGEEEKRLGTVYNDESALLAPGASVSRTARVKLPQLLGIDGDARVRVRLVPDSGSGERTEAQGNNTATSGMLLNVSKQLLLQLPTGSILENSSPYIEGTLLRTGSWRNDETFMLSITGDDRLPSQLQVTIPARQSSVRFQLPVANNDVVDESSAFLLSVEGNGYAAVTEQIVIEDDELPALTVTASKLTVSEGDTFQLTIGRSYHLQEALTVMLTCEHPARFTYPQQVTIPAGQQSVTVEVTAKHDDLPGETLSTAFIASTPRYEKGEAVVLLEDDDMPVLQLSLVPCKVQEGAGPVSVAGILRRTGITTNKITVRLSDDSHGELYFGTRELVLTKGVEEVSFNFGPVDNAQVDGDRTYTVTAAVWLSSCSCSAAGESAGSVSTTLEVIDDDGPALTLTSSLSTIKEGGKAMLTVGRNTLASLDQPLIVHLSSDYDDNLSYNHTVTIPAGQQTAQVEVTSTKNDVGNDTHTAVFTAQAEGFASATCYMMITDQSLPDAVITSISVEESEVEAGGLATIIVTVMNGGQAVLPAHVPTDLYFEGYNTSIGTLYSTNALEPGEAETITKRLKMPSLTGDYRLYGLVNNLRETKELLYTNNHSIIVTIRLKSPYKATIASDKTRYQPADTIHFNGIVEGKAGANANVEVYLINDGVRQTLSAATDNEGKFALSYVPYERQMGHFTFGACYPGEGLSTEQGSFEYVGLRRTTQQHITCEVMVGTPYTGAIEIENPCSLSQHNIHAEVMSAPENCEISITPLNEIPVSGKTELQYTINATAASSGTEWKSIKIRIASDEGASTEVALYCYCRLPQAQLALDVEELNTTMTKGVIRDYPITIFNKGVGATGRISFSLPTIIQTGTATELPSLSPEESTTVVLRLMATDDMQLNVPVTGQIGINCENGNGIALPFSLLPVSETKGTLEIDVCDEYTYYTEEAPHLAGARVQIRHPYDSHVVAEGLTGNDGLFSVELTEGYYAINVTADKHETYESHILIDPGKINKKVVNLSYQGISIEWNLEETEVEDVYNITIRADYETNVPVPVVVTELPEYISVDSMAPGESRLFYATLTNKGLVAAEGTQLIMPDVEYLTFEPLMDFPVTLLPQQAIRVPIKVTLDENVPLADSNNDVTKGRRIPFNMGTIYGGKYRIVCEANFLTLWFWYCGDDHKIKWINTGLPLGLDIKCHLERNNSNEEGDSIEGGVPDGRGGFLWLGGNGNPSGKPSVDDKECMTCKEVLREKAIDELIGMIPVVGCWINSARCAKDEIDKTKEGESPNLDTVECSVSALECALETDVFKACVASSGPIGAAVCEGLNILRHLRNILSDLSKCMGFELRSDSRMKTASGNQLSFAEAMDVQNQLLIQEIDIIMDYYSEFFGDEIWFDVSSYDLWSVMGAISKYARQQMSYDELLNYKPDNINEEQFRSLVSRIQNSFITKDNSNSGIVDFSKLRLCAEQITDIEEQAISKGYNSTVDMWLNEYNRYRQILFESANSVCASITIEIKQVMTLNRPAYRGTLTVFNGHEETAMQDVRLNLVVKDEKGNITTEREFQINAESLNGFGGEVSLTSGWTLDAQQTGTATVLFIPTKYAAPSEPVKYNFGGSLTYIDPFTGLEVTRDLLPVILTVNPLPDLELTYLMQRDVYGDDPLTKDVVEPMEEAEFALIINNKGNGEAKNLRMLTEQPKIVENEKGLFIDFDIVNSQVNGEPAVLSLGQTIANDFGNIGAHSQSYAQWWLRSSLLGHFTSYEVEANHVTSYGNQDLSLIDTVTIHEMIHGFSVAAVKHGLTPRGYLVNDIVDADDLPDIVYFTDATQQPLSIATGTIERRNNSEFLLIVTPRQEGWNYGSVPDPTGGRQKLIGITRSSDGMIIPLDNVWQTDRTLRDGRDWFYENRLHFVGEMGEEGETFVLIFEPKPDVELAVEHFLGVPDEHSFLTEPLKELTVVFNKAVQNETFTTDDLTLFCDGTKQDASVIIVTPMNNTTYHLGLEQTTQQDGYYVLTVQTAGITDTEGFTGSVGKTASWIQALGQGQGIETPTTGEDMHIRITARGDWLTVTGDFRELRSVDVYDLRGMKRIQTMRVQAGQAVYIGLLPRGVYDVQVATDRGTMHVKMLKR